MYRHLITSLYCALFLLLFLTPAFAVAENDQVGEKWLILNDVPETDGPTFITCAIEEADATDSAGEPIIWYEEPGSPGYSSEGHTVYFRDNEENNVTVILLDAAGMQIEGTQRLYSVAKAMAYTNWIYTPGTYSLEYTYLISGSESFKATREIVIEDCSALEGEGPEEGEVIEPEEGEMIEPDEGEDIVPDEGEGIVPDEGEGIVPDEGEGIVPDEGEGIVPDEGEDVVKPEGEDVVKPEGEDVVKPEGEDVVKPEGEDVVKPEGEEIVDPEEGEGSDPEEGGGCACCSGCAGCKGCFGDKAGEGSLLQNLQKGLGDWLLLSLSLLVLMVYSRSKK